MQLLAVANRPLPPMDIELPAMLTRMPEHSRPILRVPGEGPWLVNSRLLLENLQLDGWLLKLLLQCRSSALLGRAVQTVRLTKL